MRKARAAIARAWIAVLNEGRHFPARWKIGSCDFLKDSLRSPITDLFCEQWVADDTLDVVDVV